jgi:hypothetical protein
VFSLQQKNFKKSLAIGLPTNGHDLSDVVAKELGQIMPKCNLNE